MDKRFIINLAASLVLIIFFNLILNDRLIFPRILGFHFPFSEGKTITIMATGDVMLGRSVNAKMRQINDFQYPFRKTADYLKNADITIINLESPFLENCPITNTGMTFCTDPQAVKGLLLAGVNIAGLVNNHILNYGQNGRKQTIEILKQNNIKYSDSSNLVIKQFNNITIGFLSFDLTIFNKPAQVLDMVKKYANKVDFLVVSLHWGNEYAAKPTQAQKELAHSLIDTGANLIIGHHPHVIQPTEKYKNGLIFYSLGNFVFDQMWSEETKKGNIAKIIFEGKEIKSFEEIPVYIIDFAQPQLSSAKPTSP